MTRPVFIAQNRAQICREAMIVAWTSNERADPERDDLITVEQALRALSSVLNRRENADVGQKLLSEHDVQRVFDALMKQSTEQPTDP